MNGGWFLAIRPEAPWHDKFAGGGDRLLAGWLRMMCRAKQMGRCSFPSLDSLADALTVDRELLDDMVRRELVDVNRRDGSASIHDWEDHQVTFNLEQHRAAAAERKRRQRERERSATDGS